MRTVTAIVAALVLACLALTAGPGGAQAPPSIKVGAVVPLTGRYATGGAQVKAGYEFAVADVNKSGGVMVQGRKVPIQLILLDDESDATKTVSRMEALASSDHVVAYLGGFGSDLHAAAASVAEKNKIPYIGVAFALHKIHEQGFKYLFSPFPKSPEIATETYRMLNATIPGAERPRRIAIFQERTDWGAELGGLWAVRAKEFGYQVVLRAEYAVGSRDFSDVILRAKAANADAVFGLPTPPDGITIIRQMKQLGFAPKFTMLIRAADAVVWSTNLGKDGDDVVLSPGWHHALPFSGVRELNAESERVFKRPADVIVGPSYACVQILADSIVRAGALDPARIRDAIAATRLETVEGLVRFRPDGTGIMTTAFVQWQGGRQELVWPRGPATAKLIYPAPGWNQR